MNEGAPRQPIRNVELGASDEPFQNLHELISKARANLNQNAWDYIVGGAETETTLRRNRMALDEIAFRPRVLLWPPRHRQNGAGPLSRRPAWRSAARHQGV